MVLFKLKIIDIFSLKNPCLLEKDLIRDEKRIFCLEEIDDQFKRFHANFPCLNQWNGGIAWKLHQLTKKISSLFSDKRVPYELGKFAFSVEKVPTWHEKYVFWYK